MGPDVNARVELRRLAAPKRTLASEAGLRRTFPRSDNDNSVGRVVATALLGASGEFRVSSIRGGVALSSPAMRLDGVQLRFSASDLSNFLACRHLTRLDTLKANGRLEPSRQYDLGFKKLVERGKQHGGSLDGALTRTR
jgi:hypothetical protein